jgi:hypothetical protein
VNVSDVLANLAACLCAQIRDDGLPEPCFCGVMPGDRIPFDYVGNCDDQDGMAWARLITAYPASGVGRVNTEVRNCSAGIGVDIELGILRTSPVMQEDGEPPEEAAQLASSQLQVADMYAMFKAVQCCFAGEDVDYILGAYRGFGPEGYAVGGTITVMVTP